MSGPFISQVAVSIPFDNSTNGFVSTDAQAAIEEARTVIPELAADPISPPPEKAWVLRTVTGGTPIGLLLALTYTTISYQLSYKTHSGAIVRTTLS